MGQLKTPFASEETHNKPICPDYADDCGTADSQNAYAETLKILNIKLELNPQFPWKLAGLSLFSRCYGMPVKEIWLLGPRSDGAHQSTELGDLLHLRPSRPENRRDQRQQRDNQIHLQRRRRPDHAH